MVMTCWSRGPEGGRRCAMPSQARLAPAGSIQSLEP